MENGHILCKHALKNFGNVFLLTLLIYLIKTFIFLFSEKLQRTPEIVEEVRGLKEATPKSIWKLSQQIHLFSGTYHKILKKYLEMFPYKIVTIFWTNIFHRRDLVPFERICEVTKHEKLKIGGHRT
ncbi:hypothetical protein BDFB_011760 [Asbolus verrucosus]|uniref:Uncharacterized protein n=1 Tax=Asbolus verrucosus TaxID=1661398 RepID=A0A482VEQ3_ASBVE|nr:hypothetical protein BDFB_011760 [Asbolus verrucosus]